MLRTELEKERKLSSDQNPSLRLWSWWLAEGMFVPRAGDRLGRWVGGASLAGPTTGSSTCRPQMGTLEQNPCFIHPPRNHGRMKNCAPWALGGSGIHKHTEAAAAGTVGSEMSLVQFSHVSQKPWSIELLDAARLVHRILGLNWKADSFMVPGGRRRALLPILMLELSAVSMQS